eukprot:10260325-Karenia_brevis.AAC.1
MFQMHNNIAQRAAHFGYPALALGLHFVFEQPATSVLYLYDPIWNLLLKGIATRVCFAMNAFGAESRKMMALYSTPDWLAALSKHAAWLGGYT